MAARTRIDESPAKPKYRCQVKNWAEYDRVLVIRGNLTIWFDEASIAKNWTPRVRKFRHQSGDFRVGGNAAMRVCGRLFVKAL
jgi:hypothetical protein